MFAGSKVKDAAFKWISFLSTGENNVAFNAFTGQLTVTNSGSAKWTLHPKRFVDATAGSTGVMNILPNDTKTADFTRTVWPQNIAARVAGPGHARRHDAGFREALSRLGMKRRSFEPLLFLLPALLVTAAVVLYPAVQTLWLGLHSFVLFDPDNIKFIGLKNFVDIFNDELFWISLRNSVVWVVATVGLQLLLGLVTALLLNQTFWGRGAARALVVVPWALRA